MSLRVGGHEWLVTFCKIGFNISVYLGGELGLRILHLLYSSTFFNV